MSQSYIYHIHSAQVDGTGVYIGQTQQAGYIRPLDHFVGTYRAPNENILFENFLKQHSLDEIQIDIYYAPDYGLNKEELDQFIRDWKQDSSVYKVTGKDNEGWTIQNINNTINNMSVRLNAAEILHTYYFTKNNIYGPVCALSMGGQQDVSISKENIVLNRNLAPDTIASILDSTSSTRQSFGELQTIFQRVFETRAKKTGLYDQCIEAWLDQNAYGKLKTVVNNFLTQNLETIIREMQDELKGGHVALGYRIQWPKDHAINFQSQRGQESLNSAIETIMYFFQQHKNNLKQRIEKDPQNMMLYISDFFAKAFSNISIFNFITLLIKNNFLSNNIISSIGSPSEIHNKTTQSSTIVTQLKWKSYDFFRRIADTIKSEISSFYQAGDHIRKTIKMDDEDILNFSILNLPTMTTLIRDEYLHQGISAAFVTNWSKWLEFSKGMLTVYTKNRGTIVGSQLEMESVDNVFLGTIEEITLDHSISRIAYEFSPTTYDYISKKSGMNIADLEYY